MVSAVSSFLAILAFLSTVFIVLTILALLLKTAGQKELYQTLSKLVSPIWLESVFVVALVSTLGSLFYSEIAHYTPCVLCWYQRICMYPLPLLSYIAIIRKERAFIRPYLLALSVVGLGVALYHNAVQWLPKLFPLAPCDPHGVSCAKIFAVAFGFVTIPMMSFTAFTLLLTILLVYGKSKKPTK